jgi:hypothetical protein
MSYPFERTDLWKILQKISPCNARIIYDSRNSSLKEYLVNQVTFEPESSSFALANRTIVAKKLKEITDQIYPGEGTFAHNQFMESPVLQVADHSGLLYDKTIFLNNFLFQIILKENKLNYAFSKQCSRIKGQFNSTSFSGPGYLNLNNTNYNIFDLPKPFLLKSHIAAINDVTIKLVPTKIQDSLALQSPLPSLLTKLKGQKFDKAIAAFKSSNLKIWQELATPQKRKYVPFDEDLVSDIICEYILTKNPVVYNLLFNKNTRSEYLKTKNTLLNESNKAILKNTSDFFYYKNGTELKPVKINTTNNTLIESESNRAIPINLTPEDITKALKNRTLYGDLIFSYICLHLLPNTQAFGGTSQQEYLPIIQKILSTVDFHNKIFPESYSNQLKQSSKFLGTELLASIQTDNIVSQLENQMQLTSFENSFLNKNIGDLVGTLSKYSHFNIIHKKNSTYEQPQ